MATRRIVYLLVWAGCILFFWAYRQWFAWFTLVAVLMLPLFSLLVSLPGILTAQLEIHGPDAVSAGTPCVVELRCRSFLPAPPWKCTMTVERPMTGRRWRIKSGQRLPTDHCGALICTANKPKICDYLGLFSFPLRGAESLTVTVRPTPVPMSQPPQFSRYTARAWRPKRGGGFAENHELRLYRPGDSIQQIHWKLSAKTGKLILREPMEPEKGRVLLRLDLRGNETQLDQTLGRLLWLGSQLLEIGMVFQIQCLTAMGRECFPVASTQELNDTIDTLLLREPAVTGSILDRNEAAAWQYYIGGGTDEA